MTEMPPLTADGRQLELGIPALACLAPARAGIELLMTAGIARVAERVEELVAMCVTGLVARGIKVRTPLDTASRAGVVAIEHPEAVALAQFAKSRGVDIGGYPWGVARIDPHAFNDEEDIERLLAAIEAFGSGA
jgi:selenocysteine lyase/cysteine desulfurase